MIAATTAPRRPSKMRRLSGEMLTASVTAAVLTAALVVANDREVRRQQIEEFAWTAQVNGLRPGSLTRMQDSVAFTVADNLDRLSADLALASMAQALAGESPTGNKLVGGRLAQLADAFSALSVEAAPAVSSPLAIDVHTRRIAALRRIKATLTDMNNRATGDDAQVVAVRERLESFQMVVASAAGHEGRLAAKADPRPPSTRQRL
jgi:hypothetical protein